MNKPLFVISCPIDCYAGYGARSRDIAKAIIKSEKYDVKIMPQRWGNTPFGFLQYDNPEHKLILDCLLNQHQLPKQPDIWMQITVPNEFQPIGKYNIGVTAGIETTICDPSWIEGINRMNLTLVSSEHAKKVFEESTFEQRDKNTDQVVGIVKLEKEIQVLFEGLDTDIYKLTPSNKSEISNILDSIEETFLFEFTGHWLQGDLGQDRKDVGMLVKTFLETFKGKGIKPGLVLKTSSATYSIMDREEILNKINKIREFVGDDGTLPNVYLLHGELTDEEMNVFYNHPKIKVHISFTKGEGFGRPLLEASVSQKPIIVPQYSGYLDFLKYSILIPGQLTQIHPSAVTKNMLIPESSWFTINYGLAAEKMVDVYKNYKNYTDNAKKQAYLSRTEFTLDKMSEKLISILDEKAPKPLKLVLPKRIELPKINK